MSKKTIGHVPNKSEQLLLENFVALQKIMTDVSVNFNHLSKQISDLLELFENSAKVVAEREFKKEKENPDFKELMKKIEYLTEQNKVIAKGLILLHEKSASEYEVDKEPVPVKLPEAMPSYPLNKGVSGYQKSISSGM